MDLSQGEVGMLFAVWSIFNIGTTDTDLPYITYLHFGILYAGWPGR